MLIEFLGRIIQAVQKNCHEGEGFSGLPTIPTPALEPAAQSFALYSEAMPNQASTATGNARRGKCSRRTAMGNSPKSICPVAKV